MQGSANNPAWKPTYFQHSLYTAHLAHLAHLIVPMRLLHSETLQFREFFDRDIPKYAILSHRWGDKEVSFQDMEQNRAPDGAGIEKIRGCCRQACRDGLQWVWVDTCCIDKKSSAELTEAINSMFNWYYRAEMCYVHLSDVTSREEEETLRQFQRSQWFTQGWTLQELLAPQHCIFFNAVWEPIGTKKTLESELATITNVESTLLNASDIKQFLKYESVAQRMSWAASRTTTRIEDEAYCLLGIFDINMPLLYGEGAKAFRRLQLEIIKESRDESIFAWGLDISYLASSAETYERHLTSVLAAAPREFAKCKGVYPLKGFYHARTFSVTNLGLKIRFPKQAFKRGTLPGDNRLDFGLNCFYCDKKDKLFYPVVLQLRQDAGYLYEDFHLLWKRWQCQLSKGLRDAEYSVFVKALEMNDTKLYLSIKP